MYLQETKKSSKVDVDWIFWICSENVIGEIFDTPGRKSSNACAIKEFLYQDKNAMVVPGVKKSKKICDIVCLLWKFSIKST